MMRTHSELCNVPVSTDNFSVIGSGLNVNDLHILESLHILKSKQVLKKIRAHIHYAFQMAHIVTIYGHKYNIYIYISLSEQPISRFYSR